MAEKIAKGKGTATAPGATPEGGGKRKGRAREAIKMSLAGAALTAAMVATAAVPAFAATDLQNAITDAATNVYSLVRAVATPLAWVSIAIALVFSLVTHDQKKVDISRQTAKNIAIAWVILMLIGPIFNFVSDQILGSYSSDDLPGVTT